MIKDALESEIRDDPLKHVAWTPDKQTSLRDMIFSPVALPVHVSHIGVQIPPSALTPLAFDPRRIIEPTERQDNERPFRHSFGYEIGHVSRRRTPRHGARSRCRVQQGARPTTARETSLRWPCSARREAAGRNGSQPRKPRARLMFLDEMEDKGPIRITDVEEAQKDILRVARRLSDSGDIVLAGRGDDFV